MAVADQSPEHPGGGMCPWCDRPLPRGERRSGGWRVIECPRCGVGVTDPWPSPADLAAAYAGAYRPEDGRFAGPGDALLRRTRGRLARRIAALAPPGPVLDVGCGDGTLLAALVGRGRQAVGIERPEVPAAGGRATGAESSCGAEGLPAKTGAGGRPAARGGKVVGSLDEAAASGPFAAAVLWHSLEHLPRPGAALDRVAGLLVPGGLVVVAAPNRESLQSLVFGDRWLALDLPRHLVHLPASGLTARLRAAGLEPERVSHWRGGQVVFGWLHGLVGLLPGGPDLYDAIRRPRARFGAPGGRERGKALAAGAALLPVAAALAAAEAAGHRAGTVYVEARRRG